MPPDDLAPVDQKLLAALLAADEALAAGRDPTRAQSTLPEDAAPRPDADIDTLLGLIRRLGHPRAVPADPPHGTPLRLGRFEIEGTLGQGGFGIVYLARDPALGRRVALKVPRPEALMSSGIRRRFLTEARAAAGLDHPNLVAVHEVGEAGPLCYIASAYCAGPTLAGWLKSQAEPVRPELAARLVAALAAAVQHAHDRGILHRDIKPSNVIVGTRQIERPAGGDSSGQPPRGTPGDADLSPRLTDFGLARIVEESGEETRSGVPLGSPPYMSPEQAAGRNREVGPAADVYALGATLYEILTKRPPFRGESPTETIRSVLEDDCAAPRTLRPGLPRDLETICLKCLEKDPVRRYASAAALGEDLERFLRGEPIRARPVGRIERWRRWCLRPERVREAGVALVTLGLLTSGIGVLYYLGYGLGLIKPERPGDFTMDLVVAFLVFDAPPIWCGLKTLAGRRSGLWLGLATSLNFLVWLLIGLSGWHVLDYGGVFPDQTKEAPLILMLLLLVAHTVVRTGIGVAADRAGQESRPRVEAGSS